LVADAVFSADGSHIVTASYDGTLRIWNASSGGKITRVLLDAAITAMAVRNGDIALGDRFGWIHVFEAGDLLKEAGNGS
jgi:WD40 repeat protein